MHQNAQLLEQLYKALSVHEHQEMSNCYLPEARFTDIAFRLTGKREIAAMWQLVCDTDIRTTVHSIFADDDSGEARILDVYTFRETKRKVRNEIISRFQFRDGLIEEHHDQCDPLVWARQALGGLKGELVGRMGFLRRWAARKKLRPYLESL